MLKMIKTTKQMRLDELIKHVRENEIRKKAFVTDFGRASVYFDIEQKLSFGDYAYGEMDINRIFTVEIEEPIDENTYFNFLIGIDEDDFVRMDKDITISEMAYTDTESIYALINGRLELVWKCDEDEV